MDAYLGLTQLDLDPASTTGIDAGEPFSVSVTVTGNSRAVLSSRPARSWRRQRSSMLVFWPCRIASCATDTESL
jgi:hypothetical protein